MELFEDVIPQLQKNAYQSVCLTKKSTISCFPFSISRLTNRVARHLFRRNKYRSIKKNRHPNRLTSNMDSYQYTPSDDELQKLLYT